MTARASQDPATPRAEHPRPIFRREPWLSLNGKWRFGFDPREIGEQSRWYRLAHPELRPHRADAAQGAIAAGLNFEPGRGTRTGDPFADEIVVPFPWESQLSGIGNVDYKGAAWYQRILTVPAEWGTPSATSPTTPSGTPPTEPVGAPSIATSGAPSAETHGAPSTEPANALSTETSGAPSGLPSIGDASTAPAAGRWRLHPHLCFGAVDWTARVWVN